MAYKDKAVQREYQREWIKERREKWIKENGPCVICKSNVELEIDHIDPLLKKYNINSIWSSTKNKRDKELNNCQVLCLKCHKKKNS